MFDKIIEAARQRHIARLLAEESAHQEPTYTQAEVLELLEDFEKERSTKVIFAKEWFNKFKKK